jgi:hypothetical protein
MILVQLNPPMPFLKDGKKCLALMALDYGPEYETLFLCGMIESRELWWIPHSQLRLDNNISLGRTPSTNDF